VRLGYGPCRKTTAVGPKVPVNSGLLEIDSLDCKDEMPKADGAARAKADKDGYGRAMVDDFVSCMREHGYVQTKS
jgi:hypothetical protein